MSCISGTTSQTWRGASKKTRSASRAALADTPYRYTAAAAAPAAAAEVPWTAWPHKCQEIMSDPRHWDPYGQRWGTGAHFPL
eukprot:11895090-Alexandrium_andersonii.AAC.1